MFGLIEQRGPSGNSGFTLIEILVSISILSLVLVLLTSSLFGVGQLERMVKTGADRREVSRAVVNFFRTTLGTLFNDATRDPVAPSDQISTLEVDGLEWTGFLHGREGMGGRYRMKLAFEGGAVGAGGKIYFSTNSPKLNDLSGTGSVEPLFSMKRLVLSEVSAFSINIEAAKESVLVRDRIAFVENPLGIKRIVIRVAFNWGDWPDIVVTPRPFRSIGDNGFAVGGGALK